MNTNINEKEKTQSDSVHERLSQSYVQARKQIALQEIELSRAHVVIVSQDGKSFRIPLLKEH